MGLFLGIDGGGTKTACVLADASGKVIARATGPGTNLGKTSSDSLRSVLEELVAGFRSEAKLDSLEFDCICAGFAGAGDPSNRARAESVLQDMFNPAMLHVVGDMEIALGAAVGDGPGVVLIAGTGSIAYGRGADGATARAGGKGSDSGDPGSGYAIGYAAVAAVLEGTADEGLSGSLREFLGSSDDKDLRELLEAGDASRLAALTPAVHQAFESGSAVATVILQGAAMDLAHIVKEVVDRLGLSARDAQVVAAGGAFRASPELRRAVEEALIDILPGLGLLELEISPAEGAVRMGRRMWQKSSAEK